MLLKKLFKGHRQNVSQSQKRWFLRISQVFEGISTGMVLEKGNFEWTKEELAVARAKGIKINE